MAESSCNETRVAGGGAWQIRVMYVSVMCAADSRWWSMAESSGNETCCMWWSMVESSGNETCVAGGGAW